MLLGKVIINGIDYYKCFDDNVEGFFDLINIFKEENYSFSYKEINGESIHILDIKPEVLEAFILNHKDEIATILG